MSKSQLTVILLVVSILCISSGSFMLDTERDSDKVYTYRVTTEGVISLQDYESDSESISELSEGEQQLIEDAFSRSNRFTVGDTIHTTRTEPIEFSGEMRVVEIDGIPVIIHIAELERTAYNFSFQLAVVLLSIGSALFSFSIGPIYLSRWHHGKQRGSVDAISLRDL